MPNFIVEYDFKQNKEYIGGGKEWVEDNELELLLGTHICALLSLDFEKTSADLGNLFCQALKNKEPFPHEQIIPLLSEQFCIIGYDYWENFLYPIKCYYEMFLSKGLTKITDFYCGDSVSNFFFYHIYSLFKPDIAIKAYLDKSESLLRLRSSEMFEMFWECISGCHIEKQDSAVPYSDFDFLDEIEPGKDLGILVEQVTKDFFASSNSEVVLSISQENFLPTSVYYFLSNNLLIKRCKNCGKYFIPFSRSDEIYCNDQSPQDPTRTCKEYGSQKLWYERLRSDEVAKLARNIYSSKQMLVRRNPDILGYQKMFEYFKEERKKWERQIKSGEKSKEEYISWLNEMRLKKTL